jgi:hypothetical protein
VLSICYKDSGLSANKTMSSAYINKNKEQGTVLANFCPAVEIPQNANL